MSTFNLIIELGNDAMRTPEDVQEALQRLSNSLSLYAFDGLTRDVKDGNGNTVGGWSVADSAEACAECGFLIEVADDHSGICSLSPDNCECSESYRHRGEHTPGCPEDDGERVTRYAVGDKVTWRMSRTADYPGDGVEYPGVVAEVMPADEQHPHGGEYLVQLNGDSVLAWWEELATR